MKRRKLLINYLKFLLKFSQKRKKKTKIVICFKKVFKYFKNFGFYFVFVGKTIFFWEIQLKLLRNSKYVNPVFVCWRNGFGLILSYKTLDSSYKQVIFFIKILKASIIFLARFLRSFLHLSFINLIIKILITIFYDS